MANLIKDTYRVLTSLQITASTVTISGNEYNDDTRDVFRNTFDLEFETRKIVQTSELIKLLTSIIADDKRIVTEIAVTPKDIVVNGYKYFDNTYHLLLSCFEEKYDFKQIPNISLIIQSFHDIINNNVTKEMKSGEREEIPYAPMPKSAVWETEQAAPSASELGDMPQSKVRELSEKMRKAIEGSEVKQEPTAPKKKKVEEAPSMPMGLGVSMNNPYNPNSVR